MRNLGRPTMPFVWQISPLAFRPKSALKCGTVQFRPLGNVQGLQKVAALALVESVVAHA